jgi:hypothetical protein
MDGAVSMKRDHCVNPNRQLPKSDNKLTSDYLECFI